MNMYFTADLHLYHKNIIKYCNRPFKNLYEMHEVIRNNWNAIVKPEDSIYVLGDISFGTAEQTAEELSKLNGKKFLILGNHDLKRRKLLDTGQFEWVKHYHELKVWDTKSTNRRGQYIILNHYAQRVWNCSHYGAWHLYGHSHGSLPDDPNALSWDVGVDNNDFAPVSYERVREIMETKNFVPVDHHK